MSHRRSKTFPSASSTPPGLVSLLAAFLRRWCLLLLDLFEDSPPLSLLRSSPQWRVGPLSSRAESPVVTEPTAGGSRGPLRVGLLLSVWSCRLSPFLFSAVSPQALLVLPSCLRPSPCGGSQDGARKGFSLLLLGPPRVLNPSPRHSKDPSPFLHCTFHDRAVRPPLFKPGRPPPARPASEG